MNPTRLRELCAAPELALLPPMLAMLDAIVSSLHAQHPTIEHEWTAGDPHTLRDARALVAAIARTRRAVVDYRAAVRRSLRTPYGDIDDLPF